MFVIINSIRQTLRTPVKTALFLMLIALSTAFVSIGTRLWLVSGENFQTLKSSFITIGTVQQKPNILKEVAQWDAGREAYSYFNVPVYDSEIPLSVLNFANAGYIHTPKKRPYYGAYHESYVTDPNNPNFNTQWIILEAEPLTDCVPAGPIRMRVKRVLRGELGAAEEIWFCDHHNDNPAPMYAGKTYIMSVQGHPISQHAAFSSSLDWEYIPCLGLESTQFDSSGALISDILGAEQAGWEEVTEGYYDTPRGQRWQELIKAIEKIYKTIPVVPTNATHLLMDFYNGGANIIDGRDISRQEYAEGSRVCLIQQRFAQNNRLRVGDILPLPLYYANYHNAASQNFYPGGGIGVNFGLLNAQGKSYPVFENGEYTVVGIYDSSGGFYLTSGFESAMNMVVIPAASVKNSDESNIVAWAPMQAYNTAFEIPNGTVDEFVRQWNQQGIDGLDIRFYDKGYSQLKDGIDRMRLISIILLIVGVAATLLTLAFFTFLFIVKNKKRTAIERSLGFGRGRCTISLLSGMLLLSVFGIVLGSGAGHLLSSAVIGLTAATGNGSAFSLQYSNWVNNADKLNEMRLNLQPTNLSVFIIISFVTLAVSVTIASVGISRNLQYEPLTLLSTKEDE